MSAPKKRLFGTIACLSSGKYRARYTGPDGKKYSGPHPFFTTDDAGAWLRQEQKLIEFDEWQPPHLRYRTLSFALAAPEESSQILFTGPSSTVLKPAPGSPSVSAHTMAGFGLSLHWWSRV